MEGPLIGFRIADRYEQRALNRNAWLIGYYIVFPILCVVFVYLVGYTKDSIQLPVAWVMMSIFIVCVIVFFDFLYFVFTRRKPYKMLAVSLFPPIFGPMAAQALLNAEGISVGDPIAITYCFVWSFLFSILGYLLFSVSNVYVVKVVSVFLIVVGIFLVFGVKDAPLLMGPGLLLDFSAPDLTFLLFARVLLIVVTCVIIITGTSSFEDQTAQPVALSGN